MATDLKSFGNRLRQLREARGLTQIELARQLPVSEGLISRWERAYQGQGRVWKPDRQVLLRLIDIFLEGLDPVTAQELGALAGYRLTPSELQALFPSTQYHAPATGHSNEIGEQFADPWRSGVGHASPIGVAIEQPSNTVQELFVGREEELAQLHNYLSEVLAGHGRVAFINGSVGSGKSSLMRAFARKALVEHPDLIALDGSCSAYGGYGTPYMPFREMLNVLVGDATTQWAVGTIRHTEQPRLLRLAPYTIHLLVNQCRDLIETIVPASTLRDWARALQLEHRISQDQLKTYLSAIEMAATPSNLEQRNLFEQYTALLHRISQRHPLLLVIDDLHWADAASISLLFHLGRQLQGKRILILATYRTSDLTRDHHGTHHPLAPVIHEMQRLYGSVLVDLDHTLDERFVDAYLDSEPNHLDKAFRARLLQHTRGHALFTVEMVRGMQERGEIVRNAEGLWIEGHVNWGKVPERIEGLIAELLDRLPTHLRELLNVASIQGETFIAEVTAQVLGPDEHQILHALTTTLGKNHRLVVEQGVQRIGNQRLSQFRFRHLLFQTYLYHSLGVVERTYLHEMVGSKLEALCGTDVEHFTEQLARHFQEADIPDKAVFYLLQSGKKAMRLAAHEESIESLQIGLTLLNRVPPSALRNRLELDLLVTLGISLIATKGFAVAEVEENYVRALNLSIRTGDTSLQGAILFNLWSFHQDRANYTTASDFAHQLMELAEQTQDTGLLLEAHHTLWTFSLCAGDFSAAHVHAQQGVALYRAEEHHPLTFQYGGHDPGVCCHIMGAYALWYLGYPDQALLRIQAGIALARELDHVYSLTMVLTLCAEIHLLRREGKAALAVLQEARPLAAAHAFTDWLDLGAIFRGWALAELGEAERGIEEMLHGLDAHRSTVGEETGLHCFAQLADAYGKAGKPAKGLALLDVALAVEDKNKLRDWSQWQSELFRLQGELTQAQKLTPMGNDAQLPEDSFRRAIDIARQQDARLPELRAVVSLCRLWQAQGKRAQAHTLLAQIYGWFTEGFDTADLLEAKALLEHLK